MKISKIRLAVIGLIIANFIWGAAPPIFKWSLQGIHPFTLAFFRSFIAAMVLLPFTITKLKVKRRDVALLILLSVLGMAFNISYFLWGLQYTQSINAPIISSAAPILLIIGSVVFLHERPKVKVVLGTIISLIGVSVIVFQPLLITKLDGAVMGNAFFVVAMMLSVLYTLLLKEIMPRYSSFTITFWVFAISSLALLPFVLLEIHNGRIIDGFTGRGIIGILWGGFISSAIAYLFYSFAVKYIATSEVGIFLYVDPVVTAVIAWLLLGETVNPTFLFGAVLVFFGIFIAKGRLHFHPVHLLR